MGLKAIWKENNAYSKLLLTVGVVLVFTTLFTVLATALAAAVYGVSADQLPSMMNSLDNPTGIGIMKMVQAASTLGAFIAPALFLGFVFSDTPKEYLGLRVVARPSLLLLAAALTFFAVPVINALVSINEGIRLPSFLSTVEMNMREMEDRAAAITEAFMVMHSSADLLINIFVIALLPAIGEELLFRGVLQRIFGDWSKNVHAGIWLAAFIFSAMHMQFYGFIPRMLLGALFGYLYVWTGSLWVPIMGHFINNAAAVIVTYFYQNGMILINPDELGTTVSDWPWVAGSSILCGLLIRYFYNQRTVLQ